MMPGILKIGITKRTPEEILSEANAANAANASNIWKLPTSYNIVIAKKVRNPFEKEKTLHTLMEQYPENLDSLQPSTGFFRITPEKVIKYFNLMDEVLPTPEDVKENVKEKEDVKEDVKEDIEEDVEEDVEEDIEDDSCVNKGGSCSNLTQFSKNSNVKERRNMGDCFTDGQLIKHKIGKTDTKIRIGIYDYFNNRIICEGKFYKSISSFALTHHRIYNPNRKSVNGWAECYYKVDEKWISTYTLPKT
jgi:hypothetical protein